MNWFDTLRLFAFVAYMLAVLGWVAVLFFRLLTRLIFHRLHEGGLEKIGEEAMVTQRYSYEAILMFLGGLVNFVVLAVFLFLVMPGIERTYRQARDNGKIIEDNNRLLRENREMLQKEKMEGRKP